jgi:hypothetical protein
MSEQAHAGRVPSDFPRRGEGSLSGVQTKLAVRLIAGKFISGETDEELVERYEACRDLAAQITEVGMRKRVQYADLPLKECLRRLYKGVVNKGWDLDNRELAWLMLQVAVGMGGGPADLPIHVAEVSLQPTTSTAPTAIPSVVDVALSGIRSAPTPRGAK